ncbi:MAG TPA: hypothetical protein VHT75_01485 [Acidimicrobiales bacterium]|nr:hypothetical protein [Acidimicrobiales bacterium]
MTPRRIGVVVLACLIPIGLAACGRTHSGLGRLTVTGDSTLTRLHGSPQKATSGADLHAGDRVQVASGEAVVNLHGGVLHLRSGADLVVDATPHLNGGSILVQPSGAGISVAAQRGTLVVPKGVAQLAVGSATANLTAKVYTAVSQLDITGNPAVSIAAPRQVTLTPDTRLPVTAGPLQYQADDAWDRLYLGSAMSVSDQLAAAANGFNAQLSATEGSDPSFYQQLVPALNSRPDFVAAFSAAQHAQPLAGSPAAKPGDYLIASVIALRANGGSLINRLNDELLFHAQGANWGFVALDQGVSDLTGVLNDLLGAIGRASLPITGAPPSQLAIGPPPTIATTPTTRPPTRSTTPPATTAPRVTVPPATPTPTTNPLTIPAPSQSPPGILGGLLNPLLDPLINALNNILGGHH